MIWTRKFEGDTKKIFSYMNKVSKEVAGEMNQKLSGSLFNKLDKFTTKNFPDYNGFLQGQQLL